MVSPYLYLVGTIPDFEYPRNDLPAQIHFVGPILPDPPDDFDLPSWWADLEKGYPVVHVTQGTVATESNDLIVPTLSALAEAEVLVVATTGGKPVEAINLSPIPANARIETFIPYFRLLPHVDVMVTNGGYNGVQMALANGVALVTAGQTEDKPEVCARVEWAGVGINLKTKTPTPKQIRAAVQQLLSNPQYKARSQFFQTQMQQYNAPVRAAELLEQLATSKQPITTNA
ncbi:MAG: hypothetical protein IGS48_03510 [Oscillatoriales cyanobacterium C42_A2020_001]|nr:hypothetical protein [Leptolyngbyaceae cyanobacterium C42_A2020_001]